MNGLSCINIELTSRCNKDCWMCGRRKIERDHPEITMNYGDMDFNLVEKLSREIPNEIIVQFHNNGEPLLYPRLGDALKLFNGKIRCLDTNGILLNDPEKRKDIINNLESLTLSTFQNDPEWKKQYYILEEFLKIKKDSKPQVVIRVLGNVGKERKNLYRDTGCLIAERILHSPMGSFKYEKETIIPEHGFCLEMISHPAINRLGEISTCVRFDPHKKSVIGNINMNTLEEIWNGEIRSKWLELHKTGNRNMVPLCSTCEYWGIPKG